MNDSTTIIKRGRLIADPKSRQVGDKTLVELAVAYNTFGAKAKERYVPSYIVNCTVAGAAGERLSQLRKGDTVSATGTIEAREYKGKLYYDMPYADITVQKAAFLDAQFAEEEPAKPATKAKAPVNTKGTDANPFADDDLPF